GDIFTSLHAIACMTFLLKMQLSSHTSSQRPSSFFLLNMKLLFQPSANRLLAMNPLNVLAGFPMNTFAMETMFEDPDRVPGDLGFAVNRLAGKSEEEVNKLKLQELKNGRLAMLAIGGMIHHNFVTGEPSCERLFDCICVIARAGAWPTHCESALISLDTKTVSVYV
ncbi:hypothetical protein THAOC_29025, partial [Thalassiosira oceanica]